MQRYLHEDLIKSSVSAQINGHKDRQINLALETVIKLDQSSLRSDTNFIDKMQNWISKIQAAIRDPDHVYRRRNLQDSEDKHLAEYLEKVIAVILTYDDEDLKNLAKILNEEIRKYHYRGCKFYEIANNKMFRKIMRQTLDELDKAPANVVRFHLNNALNGLKHNKDTDKKLIDFVNSLYNREAKNKLDKVVNNFKFYKIRTRAEDDRNDTLQTVVKSAVKDLVFDHYSSLNDNARKTLRVHIDAYLDDLFKPNGVDIGRKQGKRHNAHLIGSEEISKLFKEPENTETKTVKEKYMLRGGKKSRVKTGITKGLMEKVSIAHETTSETKEDVETDAESSSDSLNEKTATEEVTEKVTTKKIKRKRKKAKTTKKSTRKQRIRTNKAKRFKTQKNNDAMMTIWEEVQTVEPKPLRPLFSVASARAEPKERVIIEEQNAVINIGTWENGLRKPTSDENVNARADDLNININTADVAKTVEKFTEESEDEGLTLEFDRNNKPNRDIIKNLRKNIYDAKETETKQRAGTDSEDSNNSSDESDKKITNNDKPKDNQPLNDDVSKEYSPEIDYNEKVTAALVDDKDKWDTRKQITRNDSKTSYEERLKEITTQRNVVKLKTSSLSEEDDEKMAKNGDLVETSAAPAEKNEDSKNYEATQRRDNNDRDNFGITNSTPNDNEPSEKVTINKNPPVTFKASVKENDEKTEKDAKSEVTKPDHLKEHKELPNTVAKVDPAESTKTQKLETDKSETEIAKETTNNSKVDDKRVDDDKIAHPKTPENDNQLNYAKDNTTIGNSKIQDDKLKDMVKELDAVGDKATGFGGSENKEGEKTWEENNAI